VVAAQGLSSVQATAAASKRQQQAVKRGPVPTCNAVAVDPTLVLHWAGVHVGPYVDLCPNPTSNTMDVGSSDDLLLVDEQF